MDKPRPPRPFYIPVFAIPGDSRSGLVMKVDCARAIAEIKRGDRLIVIDLARVWAEWEEKRKEVEAA